MVSDKSTKEDGNPYDKVQQAQQSASTQSTQTKQKKGAKPKNARSGIGLHIVAALIIIAVLAAREKR